MTGRLACSPRRAVFLDRDGVLIDDVGPLRDPSGIRVLDGVPEALAELDAAGFALVVITNQPVVARGLASETDVAVVNAILAERIAALGGPRLGEFYVCPHHPRATLPAYRRDCACRKPRPGLIQRACAELDLNVSRSFLVGDRPTDVAAGARAGCRTILVETGAHRLPPIETADPIDPTLSADRVCAGLPDAARWLLSEVA